MKKLFKSFLGVLAVGVVYYMVSILGSLPHFLRKRAHEMTKAKESQNADIVIYNRVPKCASSVMMRLISILHQPYAHDFQFENQIEPGQAHWFETAVDEEEWALDLALREKPTFVLRHQYFVDLDKYVNNSRILWLNLVRDPIDQFVSHYYYMRHGFEKSPDGKNKKEWANQNLKHINPETRNLTLDECIEQEYHECVNPVSEYMQFFCGNEERCRVDKSYALKTAAHNIRYKYYLVGYTDRLHEFLTALHYTLPAWFKGSNYYYRQVTDPNSTFSKKFDTRTANKVIPSDKTLKFLNDKFKYEVQLYKFIKLEFKKKLVGWREEWRTTEAPDVATEFDPVQMEKGEEVHK